VDGNGHIETARERRIRRRDWSAGFGKSRKAVIEHEAVYCDDDADDDAPADLRKERGARR
jgi:hypothetical protein